MTAQPTDVERLLSAWLQDGIDTAPPAVVRAALDQATMTRQRRELGFIRRVYNVEETATLNRNNWLRVGLLGMAGVVALIAVAGAVKLLAPDELPPATAPATALVEGLPAPPSTDLTAIVEGPEAITALRTGSRVTVFSQARLQELGGEAAAALFNP